MVIRSSVIVVSLLLLSGCGTQTPRYQQTQADRDSANAYLDAQTVNKQRAEAAQRHREPNRGTSATETSASNGRAAWAVATAKAAAQLTELRAKRSVGKPLTEADQAILAEGDRTDALTQQVAEADHQRSMEREARFAAERVIPVTAAPFDPEYVRIQRQRDPHRGMEETELADARLMELRAKRDAGKKLTAADRAMLAAADQADAVAKQSAEAEQQIVRESQARYAAEERALDADRTICTYESHSAGYVGYQPNLLSLVVANIGAAAEQQNVMGLCMQARSAARSGG